MDPALPPSLPPLGRTFYITIFAPLAPLALCLLTSAAAGNSKDAAAPFVFLFCALPAMLGCSIAGAIMVGKRKGVPLGILTFFGLQVLYIGVAFAGCVSSFTHMDFK